MTSIIKTLRKVKDPTNIFFLKRYIKSTIYIKNVSIFLSSIRKYHLEKNMNIKDDVIFYVLTTNHTYHFFIYENGDIFIHYLDHFSRWNHIHLSKDEIFDDDYNLCLSKGRVLFEEF